jgi:chromosome segregation ATPase
MSNSKKHHFTGSGIVIAAIILVLGAGTIFFFVSDPFNTKVKEGYKQATKWTPENIQKDPVGYLTWAVDRCESTKKDLESTMISLKTKNNDLERKVTTTESELANYEDLLQDLKQLHKETEANDSWPATYKDHQFDKNELQNRVVETFNRVENLEMKLNNYTNLKEKITSKLSDVEAKKSELNQMEDKLETQLEMAKVNDSVSGLEDIGGELHTVLDKANALATTTDDSTDIDNLVKSSEDEKTKAAFDKIMRSD